MAVERPMVENLETTYREHPGRLAHEAGFEAVENALRDQVDVSLHVNGRLIATRVDPETVHRIMALLTGLER